MSKTTKKMIAVAWLVCASAVLEALMPGILKVLAVAGVILFAMVATVVAILYLLEGVGEKP